MKLPWYDDNRKDAEVSDLVGATLTAINKNDNDETLEFISDTGHTWLMGHNQDCCESVTIDDIIGDLADLLNTPIVSAEECSNEAPETAKESEYPDESFTWTFYRFRTIKGTVTIKWYGTSNGYYSESVDFIEMVATPKGKE